MTARPTTPKSQLTHAWGSPAVTMSCGVPRPTGYSPTSSETLAVNGVQWFQQIGQDAVVWTAIRPAPLAPNPIYVRLTVPRAYPASDAFLTSLAAALKSSLG